MSARSRTAWAVLLVACAGWGQALTLENRWLRIVVDPDAGGRITALVDKRTGAELAHAPPAAEAPAGSGLLNDRFWGVRGQDRRFPSVAYSIEQRSDQHVVLAAARKLRGVGAMLVRKRVQLPVDRASLRVSYEVRNVDAVAWEGRLWIANVAGPSPGPGETVFFQYPTALFSTTAGMEGAVLGRHRIEYARGERRMGNSWIIEPRSGWMAITRADGSGVGIATDRGYVHRFYSHQPPGSPSGPMLATSEILFGPLLLKPTADDAVRDRLGIPPLVGQSRPGRPFRADLELLPLPALGEHVVDIHDGLAVGATWADGRLVLRAYTAMARDLAATVAVRALPDGAWSELGAWTASLRPGETDEKLFTGPLPTGSRVLRVVVGGRPMTLPFLEGAAALEYEEEAVEPRKTDFEPRLRFAQIDDGPPTPHTAWSKPLRRRPRVLLLLADRSSRDVGELKQRFDLDLDVCPVAHPHYFTYRGAPVGVDPHRLLPHLLAQPHDVIVLAGGLHWSILPSSAREEILRQVEAGTGLLYIAPRAGDGLFANSRDAGPPRGLLLDGEPDAASASRLVRGIPREGVPVLAEWADLADRVRVLRRGKGVVVTCAIPVWPYRRPYMVRQSLRPFATREQTEGVEYDYGEIHWLLTCRLLAGAAGVEASLDLAPDQLGLSRAGLSVTVRVANLAPDPVTGTMTARWLNRVGTEIGIAPVPVNLRPGTGVLELPAVKPTALLPGTVVLELVVRDADGCVLGNAAATGEFAGPARLETPLLRSVVHRPGEPVAGTTAVAGMVPDDARVVIRVRDMLGRLVARAAVPVPPPAPAAPESGGPVDLLRNGDFEQSNPAGGLPPGWGWTTSKHADILELTDGARPGGKGAKVLRVNATRAKPSGGLRSELLPVDPTRPLTVSGWLKASGTRENAPGGYLGVAWHDAERRPVAVNEHGLNYVYVLSAVKDTTWRRGECVFRPTERVEPPYQHDEIPPAAAFADIRAFALEYPGPVMFDDIEVRQESDAPPPPLVSTSRRVSFSLAPTGGLTQLHRLETTLVDAAGQVLDTRWTEFTVDLPEPDDVTFQVWGPNALPGTAGGDLESRVIAETGFDFATVNAGATPPTEVRGYCVALMRHGLRAMPMSLMRISAERDSLGGRVRVPCLTDPAFLREQEKQLTAYTKELHHVCPPGYFNGDENSLGSYSAGHDFCQSPSCLRRYRLALRDRYDSPEALNREWGTQFADWEDVRPDTLAEAQARGDFTSWAEHRAYMPEVLAEMLERQHTWVKRGRAEARLAASGMGNPTLYNGFDWPLLLPHLNHAALYARQHTAVHRAALFRQFRQPGARLGTWTGYGAQSGFVDDAFWWEVLNGFSCPAYYSSIEYLCTPGMGVTEDAVRLRATIAELKSGIGKLLLGAVRQQDPILVLHSYRNAVAWTAEHHLRGEGLDFGTAYDALDGLLRILQELGYQAGLIDQRQLTDPDDLDPARCRVLFAPLALTLGGDERKALRRYVEAGGVLVVDPTCGLRSAGGKPVADLDFTVWLGANPSREASDAYVSDRAPLIRPRGAGRVVLLFEPLWRYPALRVKGLGRPVRDSVASTLAHAGVRPRVTIDAGQVIGAAVWNGEIVSFDLGDGARLLALRRSFAAHPAAEPPSTELDVSWGEPAHVFDVRAGTDMGEQGRWSGDLPPGAVKLLALLQEPARAPTVRASAVVSAGEAATVEVRLSVRGRRVIHLEVHGPGGAPRTPYAANAWLADGAAVFRVPHALDDQPGPWRATCRDVATGLTADVEWRLVQPGEEL